MRRIWWPVVFLLLAGCGIQPSPVTDAGRAPTGVARGVTLYFVDERGELRPQLRDTGRLGTINEALTLLLWGPGVDSGLRTELPTEGGSVLVTTTPDVIELRVPLAVDEVTPLGIDQLVCTALGVHVQGGGSTTTTVRIRFTLPAPGSDRERRCPLIR